ncbi:MAG: ATP-binding cassette domain-containing protein [Rhodospirillaceae bacterium]
MNLLRLLSRSKSGSLNRLLTDAVLSSLSSTLVLAIVNAAAGEIAARRSDQINRMLAAAFLAAVAFYFFTESRMVSRLATDAEEAVDHIRQGLLDRLRRAGLWQIEHFGQAPLFESITRSTQTVSQSSQFLALSIRSVILSVLVLLNIATLSLTAFALISLMLISGAWAYVRLGHHLNERRRQMMQTEAQLFEGITDLFDGFKEQKLSSARSSDLGREFTAASLAATDRRFDVHVHGWQQFIFGELAFNFMLGVVVFAVPVYAPNFSTEVVKVTASVLFMMGPMFGLMQMHAVMGEAEAAAGHMLELEGVLDGMLEPGGDRPPLPVPVAFSEISLAGVSFAYPAPPGERPFTIGPLDLTVKRGEILFITGGNGSGKSTLIRLLTGLYTPGGGRLAVDDITVSPRHLQSYRELIAAVFSDFHLFPRLYADGEVDVALVESLLVTLEMNRITTLEGDRFTRRALSAGQRKRLALIAALAERRSILVLDEWAADQDPYFRHKFYRELLPDLKRRGLTVIAVTHDDHYFDVADRRFHLEEGRLIEIQPEQKVKPPAKSRPRRKPVRKEP